MNNALRCLLFALALKAHAAPPEPPTAPPGALEPLAQQAQTAFLAAQLVTTSHYKAMPLDDAMSAKVFDQFLKALDDEKIFFVAADIERLGRFRHRLDDAILDEDLAAPFAIFNLCLQRAYQRLGYARRLLARGFDFRQKEGYRYDRENAAWATSESEIRELWRKRVKNDWLRLRLAGKNDQAIVALLDKRYGNAMKRLGRLNSEDVFQKFMNAYTLSIEPHSRYLGPRAATEFDISLRLALVGVGATMGEINGYITVLELAPGGPASLSGQLSVGDRIVGAAQGEHEAMTPIIGWRLDDVAALIRGAADSIVRVEVLVADAGPDATTRTVSLMRKKLRMDDESARKSIVSVADGDLTQRIGVITLPAFYLDFAAQQQGDVDYKSATRDVARLLAELRADGVDGVLIDLRNNGGGSMSEAIELTGLFIDQGPVLQQRDALGQVSVGRDAVAGVAWDGPLGVLINRGSASASEVFAAAMQDYQRGVLIGETSYGKGSIQTLIDLNRLADNGQATSGELKLTVAQIFRINGASTQRHGVTPDIRFPSASAGAADSESGFGNALPWLRLRAVDYSPVADLSALRPILQARHQARVKQDEDFQSLQSELVEFKRLRRKNLISLNEAERRQDGLAQQVRQKRRAARTGQDGAAATSDTSDDGLLADERSLANQLVPANDNRPARDVFLIEAAHIVGDEAALLTAPGRLARTLLRASHQEARRVMPSGLL